MKKTILYLLMLIGLLSAHPGIGAEDIDKIAGMVKKYTTAGNYTKALEELAWYKNELEKRHFNKILGYFHDQIAGYQRQQPKTQSTVGITSIEALYRNEEQSIKVVLTGGSGGSAGAMGSLAAFGQLAAIQNGPPGQNSFRLKGFTATLNKKRLNSELSVFIDSGWVIKYSASDGAGLRPFAESFPISELNGYLKGEI